MKLKVRGTGLEVWFASVIADHEGDKRMKRLGCEKLLCDYRRACEALKNEAVLPESWAKPFDLGSERVKLDQL